VESVGSERGVEWGCDGLLLVPVLENLIGGPRSRLAMALSLSVAT